MSALGGYGALVLLSFSLGCASCSNAPGHPRPALKSLVRTR